MSATTYADGAVTVVHGDCVQVMAAMPDASIDAVITDPPYLLGFMGRAWDTAAAHDHLAWHGAWAAQCLRVLRPGGHLAAFGGSRTWHRLAVAVEDAGFEIRDSIAWLYASGFPKSYDVAAGIDRLDAAELRRARALAFTGWLRATGITAAQVDAATASVMGGHYLTDASQPAVATPAHLDALRPLIGPVPAWVEDLVAEREVVSANHAAREVVGRASGAIHSAFDGLRGPTAGASRTFDVTAPHTEDAQRWAGWGTALKPAFEPIVLARKPLAGTVAATVAAHGTGAINIDAARVPYAADDPTLVWGEQFGGGQRNAAGEDYRTGEGTSGLAGIGQVTGTVNPAGRWPTNVVLDDGAAAVLDAQAGQRPGFASQRDLGHVSTGMFGAIGDVPAGERQGYDDSGGASRFFPVFRYEAKAPAAQRPRVGGVAHPTVKPIDLMAWLVRLLTPPGGIVLDPFAGSGTTAAACVAEGFACHTIEAEAAYLPLIDARLRRPVQLGLDVDWTAT